MARIIKCSARKPTTVASVLNTQDRTEPIIPGNADKTYPLILISQSFSLVATLGLLGGLTGFTETFGPTGPEAGTGTVVILNKVAMSVDNTTPMAVIRVTIVTLITAI